MPLEQSAGGLNLFSNHIKNLENGPDSPHIKFIAEMKDSEHLLSRKSESQQHVPVSSVITATVDPQKWQAHNSKSNAIVHPFLLKAQV